MSYKSKFWVEACRSDGTWYAVSNAWGACYSYPTRVQAEAQVGVLIAGGGFTADQLRITEIP